MLTPRLRFSGATTTFSISHSAVAQRAMTKPITRPASLSEVATSATRRGASAANHAAYSRPAQGVRGEQRVIFALCPVCCGFGLLLERADRRHIVRSSRTDQHCVFFAAENISASDRRIYVKSTIE